MIASNHRCQSPRQKLLVFFEFSLSEIRKRELFTLCLQENLSFDIWYFFKGKIFYLLIISAMYACCVFGLFLIAIKIRFQQFQSENLNGVIHNFIKCIESETKICSPIK